jgi:hypothetical protein
VLVVSGVVWTFVFNSVDVSYLRNWCSDHTVPWTLYATAYLALACGLGGVALGGVLWRVADRRGWSVGSVWQGSLSLVFAVLGLLPVCLEVFLAWASLHEGDMPADGECGGMAVLHGVMGLLA